MKQEGSSKGNSSTNKMKKYKKLQKPNFDNQSSTTLILSKNLRTCKHLLLLENCYSYLLSSNNTSEMTLVRKNLNKKQYTSMQLELKNQILNQMKSKKKKRKNIPLPISQYK